MKNEQLSPSIVGKEDKIDKSNILILKFTHLNHHLTRRKNQYKNPTLTKNLSILSHARPIPLMNPEVTNSPRSKTVQETPNLRFDKMPYVTPLRTPQRLADDGSTLIEQLQCMINL